MKKFLCNLIVPAMMFASLVTLPLWADKVVENPADSQINNSQVTAPAEADEALVARVADPH